eukprot:5470923-Alexandrium_andersonii.AAC.1
MSACSRARTPAQTCRRQLAGSPTAERALHLHVLFWAVLGTPLDAPSPSGKSKGTPTRRRRAPWTPTTVTTRSSAPGRAGLPRRHRRHCRRRRCCCSYSS